MLGDAINGRDSMGLALAALTEPWTAEAGGADLDDTEAGGQAVWRRAIGVFESGSDDGDFAGNRAATRRRSFWNRPAGRVLRTATLAAIVVVLVGGIMVPSLGKARNPVAVASSVDMNAANSETTVRSRVIERGSARNFDILMDVGGDGVLGRYSYGVSPQAGGGGLIQGGGGQSPFQAGTPSADFDNRQSSRTSSATNINSASPGVRPPEPTAVRHVVRRATMQIETDDVRAAFTLARQLVNPARGEYVQAGDIREHGEGFQADLVLRVEAGRLDAVLIELRDLGDVLSDRIDTDDVTDRVVDLEARLRNERSVEAELLRLLEDRADDELQDVLNVRRELARIRQEIERMVAQRHELARLVSLSTITVVLREPAEAPAPEPEPEKKSGWELFTEDLRDAFGDGLLALGDTATGFVRVVIGGLVWWIGIVLVFVIAWRKWRASNPAALPE